MKTPMHSRLISLAIATMALTCGHLTASGQAPAGAPSDGDVFQQMFDNARQYAADFPQEKVYLHLDNNSYYQGDTIWYKAYVVMAADNTPTRVSKPLYVELLNQLGNTVTKQIVEITDGHAEGCIPLDNTFFSGYFELRAYTKWMLAEPEPQYFSRVLPVYSKMVGTDDEPRRLADVSLKGSESLRVEAKDQAANGDGGRAKFAVRFFPEGGRMVKGVPCRVAFEAFSADSGAVNREGTLILADGTEEAVRSLYDGIGSFTYTPGDRPATFVMAYDGKERRFTLPDADDAGLTLRVEGDGRYVNIDVQRDSAAAYADSQEPCALFLFAHGVPVMQRRVDFGGTTLSRFRIPVEPLPAGINCAALLDTAGRVLADRFFFVQPTDSAALTADRDTTLRMPFQKITYKIRATGHDGSPAAGTRLSVSVRDAINSDYRAYDDNIATDLLLTSDVKGYLPHPAFYLKDRSVATRTLLDNMLMVRAWRRYDITRETTDTAYTPTLLPEHSLTLYGRVKSSFQSSQKDIVVTVLGQRDSTFAAGSTMTDQDGNFSLPLNSIDGDMDSYIQTRKQGKKINRWTNVSLFRNFEPTPRVIGSQEETLAWDRPPVDTTRVYAADSAYRAEQEKGVIQLEGVVVKGKNQRRKRQQETELFERRVLAVYDIRREVDKVRDAGKDIYSLEQLLRTLNPNITVSTDSDDEGEPVRTLYYGSVPVRFYIDGKQYWNMFFDKDVDAMRTIMLYEDDHLEDNQVFSMDQNYQYRRQQAKEGWTGTDLNAEGGIDTIRGGVVCAIQMAPGWNAQKIYKIARGIRHTVIQGYTRPVEFYSPVYADPATTTDADRRRTLLWNPSVTTDSNGEATVECWNAARTTIAALDAEGIVDGKPLHVTTLGR